MPDDKGTITRCLKYSERSKILTVMGRCDSLDDGGASLIKIYEQGNEIFTYLTLMQQQGHYKEHPHYQLFPTIRLLEQHRFSWRDFYPNDGLSDAQQNQLDKYFKKLREDEPELWKKRGKK